METRKSFFKKFGRCWNCSKKGHRVKECKSKNMCSCGGRHHPSICDGENYGKKVEEKETKLETKVSGLQVQTKQPEEPVELKELREVNVATTVKTGGGTALQTLQAIVTANGGEQSVRCRLLLDSACNKTFITTELAELFKANPKCTEMVNVSSFGKQKGSIRSDVYDVEIKGLDHKNKIKAEVFTVPTITTLPNSKPEVVKENYEHLKDLWFPDVSEKDTLEVHMLVGMDLLWQLQTGHSKRGTTEEPVAIETIFGWTLAGKIGGSNSSEMKVNVNLFIEEGGKNGIENNLKKLWDYETLGIRETDDVYEDMVDSIRFTGERYSVRLPWKTGNYHLPDNYRLSQSRMQSQLKKLKKEPEKLQAYHEIITDQLNEGIVEKVMAARCTAKLVQNVEKALSNQRRIEGRTLWSDSKTVLCWLRNKKEWKQFVKHRVNDILKVSDNEHWKYCPSEDNPADIGTRGMIASKLNESQLWWNGPSWLVKEESFWPKQEPISDTEETEEERATSMVALDITDEDGLGSIMDVTRYGTLWKLFRITAWVVRFVWNIRAKLRGKQKISDEFLHTEETEAARKMWLISAQEDLKKEKHFPELEKRLGIKENDGILRCYGRLDHAVLGEEAKHPVILPKHHPVTRLIVDSCHRHVLHGGTRNTLAEFRSQYWMGKARQVIKAILRRCATCKRHQARPFNKPAPGQLPEFRVTPARPFQNCGVDFAGPLYVLRRKSMKKVYITLFTCGVTRAIHLELVPDLSAETFKQTLKKFTARRGTPSLMVSDNAKTFEATAKWLKKLYRDPTVQHFLQENSIRWRFNLSLAPWWGGFFERLVGLVKRTLRKVLGNARLRFEELETILIETEGMLNNRPLTYLYEEATEDVLTPNHLIFGHRLGTLPDAEVDSADEDTDEGKRMKYIRTRQQHLWNRWEKEYLTNLREYHEMGTSGSSKPEIGEVVLIKEEQTNRGKWKLGRIVSLIEGHDGIMRGATIRVISGGNPREIQRPIQKLYSMELKCRPDEAMPAERQLPVQPDEEARNVRPRRLAAMDGEIRRRIVMEDQSDDDV